MARSPARRKDRPKQAEHAQPAHGAEQPEQPENADKAAKAEQPGKLQQLRDRYGWLDHLVRAALGYQRNHGDYYAAAVTYYSVLALVPLLMVAFAIAGFVLAAQPDLLRQLQEEITAAAPGGLGQVLNDVVDQAITSRGAVGIIGLLGAAYAGLGWMGHLRDALTAQWEQPHEPEPFVKKFGYDALALLGLGGALLASFAVTAIGTAFSGQILELLGLDDAGWARALAVVITVALSLGASWLVFLWVIARLPREPVTWRSAARAALLAAVGFEVLKQVGTIYLRSVTNSPAGAAFGPVLGLLVFTYLVSRLLLFITAWAATARENLQKVAPPTPAPAVIQPVVQVRSGPDGRTAFGLFGLGAVGGGMLSSLLRRNRKG